MRWCIVYNVDMREAAQNMFNYFDELCNFIRSLRDATKYNVSVR